MNQTLILEYVNHGALAKTLFDCRGTIANARVILLLSPSLADYKFAKSIFPHSLVLSCFESDWDLYNRPPTSFIKFDLVLASNVLMYSKTPEAWICNIFEITDNFVFQDIKYRKRSEVAPYLGSDGDEIRYALNSGDNQQPTFSLSNFKSRLVAYFEFIGIPSQCHADDDPPVHICAAIRSGKNCMSGKSSRLKMFMFSCRYSFYTSVVLHTFRRKTKRIVGYLAGRCE